MVSKSRKHARTVKLNSAVNNAIEKAVDARKVAAFTVGAAGVIAGAAFAFGATPAMAAEAGVAPDTKPAPVTDTAQTPVTTGENAGKKDGEKASADKKGKDAETGKSDKKDQTDANKEAGEQTAKKEDTNKLEEKKQTASNADEKKTEQTVAKTDDKKSENTATTDDSKTETTDVKTATYASVDVTDRASDTSANQDLNKIKPNTTDATNTKIEVNENNADTMPNAYGWGSSDNTYSVDGEKHTVTFHFAVPKTGGTITNIAIFPAQNNGLTNEKSRKGAEYYSGDPNMHQSFSGTYKLVKNQDGSADLTMSTLFSIGKVSGGAEKYVASRSIFVYVTKDNKETVAYKTNVFRAVTLVPPKTSGSVVLKYNQELTPEKVQAAITEAGNVETARSDKKSVNDQLSGAFTQNINVKSADAYDAKQFAAINTETSAKDAKDKTYVAGAKTLDTYMVTDLGFKSGAIPLTVARYDTRIEKPIVEDPTKLSQEVKEDIAKKLAKINGVTADKISFEGDKAVIHFDGVDEKDAPKIAVRDLVLKNIPEASITVPKDTEDSAVKAVPVYNPIGFSNAELDRIKTAIYEANKGNKDLNLTSKDQIKLDWYSGNTAHWINDAPHRAISSGMAENTITVTIKTDKAYVQFKSDIKHGKLTRAVDIRKDYNLEWTKQKMDGRDTDEGFSWSSDKNTLIYRYDATKAQKFNTEDVVKYLKATPKEANSGLRTIIGGETLASEGRNGKWQRSNMHYLLDDHDNPTTSLTMGNMSGPYWNGNPAIDNSDRNLDDHNSDAEDYSFGNDAKVNLAAKKGKVYPAHLYLSPYDYSYYKYAVSVNSINLLFVPQPSHDKAKLKASIGEHKTTQIEGNDVPTQSAYYNASDKKKEAYDKALQTAKDLYESVKDTEESKLTEQQKAQIDNATINLNKARAELDGAKTDKDKLNASIEANGKAAEGSTAEKPGTVTTDRYKNVTNPDFKTPDGKPDSKKNEAAKKAKEDYTKALEEANKVKDDENATQKDVDAAKAKLDAAREKLNEFTTNKDKLNAAIAEHGQVNTGDATKQGDEKLKTADPTYQNSTKEEREAYDKAVTEANKVVADPNASQKEVNAAIEALKQAKEALDAKATDKSKLITAEKLTFDNPDPKDASKQSTFYKNAKTKADGNDQAAKTAVENYDNALAKAREVLKNGKATQKEVDDAKDALTKAEDALHKGYSTNADELTKVLADNFSGYLMPAYFNAFDKAHAGDADAKKAFEDYNDAYQKAKELKKNLEKAKTGGKAPAQTEIDEAKTALEKARTVIDKYATNTSRLSAAVFNDLAIKLSPAYKNVSADDASADAKAAKTKYDDAVKKLQQALEKKMPKDKQGNTEIPTSNTPDANIDVNNANALDNIQAHAQGEPLDRDITKILKEMNDAIADLNKFATKTDALLKSVNEDDATKHTPAYKNASLPVFQKADSSDADADKNAKAKQAVDKYGEMLNKAKELLKDPNATQAQINEAKKNLDDARKTLLGDPNDQANVPGFNTDTTKLQKSVGEHGKEKQGDTAAKEGTVTSDAYRNASDPHFLTADGKPDEQKNKKAAAAKKAYDAALLKAQELLKKADTEKNKTPLDAQPIQKEIDAALTTLNEKRKALDAYKTDTTELDKEAKKSTADGAAVADADFEATPEFKNAKAKTSNGVENTDVTAYTKALKDARGLLAKKDSATLSERPTQKQINDALDALKQAKKQIEDNYKTDTSKLEEAKKYAEDAFKKTPEYKNALAKKEAGDQVAISRLGKDGEQTGFDNVLKKVTDKLNDNDWKGKVTQKFVDKLLEKLQEAQDNITKNYKTDVTPLSNEVGDKDKDGKPVTPKFEESIPYKNALEKKNAGDADATSKLKDYNDKLKAAQELINKVNNPDPNAEVDKQPTNADVKTALEALQKAKKAIDDAFTTNAKDLKDESAKSTADTTDPTAQPTAGSFESTTEYQNALAKKTDDGNDNVDVSAYKEALKKARTLLNKFDENGKPKSGEKDIPSQKEVDEALKKLKEIKDKITKNYVTSPHDLQQEVDKSKDGDTDTSTDVFENTPAFKNATAKGDDAAKKALKDYNDKLTAAKNLLEKFDRTTGKPKKDAKDVPTQKQLDDALKALQDAKKKITDDYSTSKYDLRKEAGKDSDFTKSPEYQNAQAKGDDESKKALEDYKKALDEANSVLDDPNATQAEVDEALKKLQDAKSKLKAENGTDKAQLQTEADDDAKFRKSLYFIIGNKDDIEAYNTALAEANRVLADPNATQAQVDEALKKLKAAKYKLNHPFGAGSGSGIGSGYDTNAGDGFAVETSDSQSASVDKSALQVEVNNAVNTNANTAEARAYRKALAEAKRVLADKNATQAQVDEALRNLKNAKAALLNSLRGASGNAGGLANTGAETGLFASIAAAFAGLGVAGVASRRRKHSNE